MKGKKLPGKAAIGLIVGGDLLLLLVGWFLLIGPQRATAASITQATAAVEAQLVEAKRPVVKVKPPAAIVQPEIETADLVQPGEGHAVRGRPAQPAARARPDRRATQAST